MDENEYQKRIREVIEEQVTEIARKKAKEQNLPKEYEIILIESSIQAVRKSLWEKTNG